MKKYFAQSAVAGLLYISQMMEVKYIAHIVGKKLIRGDKMVYERKYCKICERVRLHINGICVWCNNC